MIVIAKPFSTQKLISKQHNSAVMKQTYVHPSFFQTSKSKILTFPERKSDIICVKRKIQYPLYFPIFLLCAKTSFNAYIKSN